MDEDDILGQQTHVEICLNLDLCIDSSDLKLSNTQVERNNMDFKKNK